MTLPEHLLQAYRNTRYCVQLPLGEIVLRVGKHSPAVDALLHAHGLHVWVFITADNPGSIRDEHGNPARRAQLRSHVQQLGLPSFLGRGIGDDPEWPAEESLLVLGLDAEEAIALGRQFGQLALLAGELGGPARLVCCSGDVE